MHKRGEPTEMNLAPRYDDVALDVFDEIGARVEAAVAFDLATRAPGSTSRTTAIGDRLAALASS